MKKNGITLIEVLVAIFIFSMCLVPIYSLMDKSGRSAKMTREEILAGLYANELMQQILGMPFQLVPPLSELPLTNEDSGLLLRETEPESKIILSDMPNNFARKLTVESVNDYLKRITVRIEWKSALKRHLSYDAFLEWNP